MSSLQPRCDRTTNHIKIARVHFDNFSVCHEWESKLNSPLILIALLPLMVDDPKPVTPVPDKFPPPLPYVTESEISWRWVHAGAPVGSTRIRLIPPLNTESSKWTLDSRLSWKRDGRVLDIRQKTDFSSENLRPISLQRQLTVEALAGALTDQVTAADFREKEARIVVRDPRSGNQVDRVIQLRDPFVLLGNQSFEHWLLIGKKIAASKEATFSALIPGEYRFLELRLIREREEKIGDLQVHRWKVQSKDFEALLWVGSKGEIERYRQGEVEIQRIRKDS